jgi:hypothetical protein
MNIIEGFDIQHIGPLVIGEKYGFIWGDDNVAGNPFVIGDYLDTWVNNNRFTNCIMANTGGQVQRAPNGRPRIFLKDVAGPYFEVSQTGGKRKQQSRRLKKKGLRKRTKNRSRRT